MKSRVMGSEMRVDYSEKFVEQLKNVEIYAEDLDIPPQIHGHDMGNHINADLELDLTGSVVSQFHFDHDMHFVGFSLYDVSTQQENHLIGAGVDTTTMYSSSVDPRIIQNYDNTRLIGFRTSKQCRQSDFISEIQPIYYSTDQ